MPDPPRVVVVGGGITGLATAWYLRSDAAPGRPEVTIVEAGDRLGGKIRTEELAGVEVEAGPDTFLARVPWATDLCRELGLGDDLVPPASTRAWVWDGDRLRPLPAGTVMGVPVTPSALTTGLLSPAGAVRATLDLVLPRRRRPSDPSVAEVVGGRMGHEVLDRMVEPLVGGINAGRAERLSLRATARPLADAANAHRSLVLGLRSQQRTGGRPQGPVFLGLAGGMERLVDRLASSLDGVEVRLETTAQDLSPVDGRGWRVGCNPGPAVTAQAVVLTIPAFAAAPVVAAGAPTAAAELERIRYASVVTATLAYRPSAVPSPLDGSGFLVPRADDRLTTACTWSTSKWPDLARSGLVLLRASAGRDGDERALGMVDDDLVAALHTELATMVGVTEPPVAWRVDRWPQALPQYEPGHEDRVERIEATLEASVPGVFVAGAAYRGLGIAACVQQARTVAARVRSHLSRPQSAPGGGNMGPGSPAHRR